jgi:hypothetical protein
MARLYVYRTLPGHLFIAIEAAVLTSFSLSVIRYRMHAGGRLSPPLGGEERMAAFAALQPTEVEVTGESWKASSVDVAIAGAHGMQQMVEPPCPEHVGATSVAATNHSRRAMHRLSVLAPSPLQAWAGWASA